jgi:hypothetical protein
MIIRESDRKDLIGCDTERPETRDKYRTNDVEHMSNLFVVVAAKGHVEEFHVIVAGFQLNVSRLAIA